VINATCTEHEQEMRAAVAEEVAEEIESELRDWPTPAPPDEPLGAGYDGASVLEHEP
jgi:hypothetical protein